MKRFIVTLIIILCVGGISYLSYSKYQETQIIKLKEDVVYYLNNEGYSEDEYKGPKYVLDKSQKGEKSRQAKIIFDKEKKYEYYYIKKDGEVQLYYASNKETREEHHDKKEP